MKRIIAMSILILLLTAIVSACENANQLYESKEGDSSKEVCIINNFIFENATKPFLGKDCIREYLSCLSSHYGKTVMLAYGGGSIKKNGVYDEVMESLKKSGKDVVEEF